jgi:general L-amino acid transport system permease protein
MVRRPSTRARAAQYLLLAAVAVAVWYLASNASDNLERRHTSFGFGFLADHANFDIPFHLLSWAVGDTYAWALVVCTANTLLVSAMSIVAASLLGLLVGIMRLSGNWLVRNLALWFIEAIRNTPQLVQVIFWYVAVLQTMPGPRQSYHLPGGALLNIRGLYLPTFDFGANGAAVGWLVGLCVVAAALLSRVRPGGWLRDRRIGYRALIVPLLACAAAATMIDRVNYPIMRGFNLAGGVQVPPELVALWAGLSIYAAAFIAEIVRSSIQAVSHGQREAALSLGLRPSQVLARVILPQALRMMVPPLTSQYLNLIKSSSLGAAIAYPELFQIFAGTVLNQSGRELETIFLLMAIFLIINLLTSAFMNWYNHRVALVER